MSTYIYKMKDESGKILHGVLEAESKKDLKYKLHNSIFYFIAARPCRPEEIYKKKINDEDLLMFTHRLSSLVGAGIPILSATNMLWRQTDNRTLQLMISHLHRHLEEGNRICQAMKDFPRIFSALYQSLIGIAEKSGRLVVVLQKLTEYLHYQKQIMIRIKKATIYPMVVVGFAIVVLLALFTFVVPIFQQVMDRLDVPLPLLTRIILKISQLLKTWYISGSVLLMGFGLFWIYQRIKNHPVIGEYIDYYKLRIPVLGNIIYMMALSRFVHALSMLLSSGVPIMESFEAAKQTALNRQIVKGIEHVQKNVQQGGSLRDSFKEAKIFPEILVDMVGVGESGGTVAEVFHNLAVHFDEEMDYKLNRLLLLLEPFLIIGVGCIVIITLLAVYLPIISIWKVLSVS